MPTDIFQNEFAAKFATHIQHLKTQFVASLEKKEQDLEAIIARVSVSGLQSTILSDLYTIAHNLAGSAPMHGFHEIAKQAMVVEDLMSRAMRSPQAQLSDMEVMLVIDELSELIRSSLEASDLSASQPT